AQAARNSGGITIAQVKRVVDAHDDPQRVRVPGILVDYVVEVGEDREHHSMTFGEYLNLDYTRAAPRDDDPHAADVAGRTPERQPPALDVRRIVQRRALLELVAHRPRVVNLGVGMPAGLGAIARE